VQIVGLASHLQDAGAVAKISEFSGWRESISPATGLGLRPLTNLPVK